MNPIDEFREVKEKEAAVRKDREIAMWQKWKEAPEHEKPQHLAPLLKAYDPLFNRKVQEWSGRAVAVQPAAFKAELHKQFIGALNSFNPERAALSTHVETRLKKAQRFVVKHQNLAYIPEGQVVQIGKINKAVDTLTEELGRHPSDSEIGDHLGMTPKRVSTIMGAMKKDIPASRFEEDPTASSAMREREVLDMLQYSLNPEEKEVFNHLFGREGKATIQSTNELARKLNKSAPQISRLKTSILAKYKRYV